MQAVIGWVPHVFSSWLADVRGLAEECGSGQHTDHSDVTDSTAATSLFCVFALLLYVWSFNPSPWSLSLLLLLWHSHSQRNLFPVIFHKASCFNPAFSFMLCVLYLSPPFLSRVCVVDSSQLCTLNIDRRVMRGWGQGMLFLSVRNLSLSLYQNAAVPLYQFLSSEGHSTRSSQLLRLLATYLHPSFISLLYVSLSFFRSQLSSCSHSYSWKQCVFTIYGPWFCLSLSPSSSSHFSNGTELAQVPRSKQVFNQALSPTNLICLDWLLKRSAKIGEMEQRTLCQIKEESGQTQGDGLVTNYMWISVAISSCRVALSRHYCLYLTPW